MSANYTYEIEEDGQVWQLYIGEDHEGTYDSELEAFEALAVHMAQCVICLREDAKTIGSEGLT